MTLYFREAVATGHRLAVMLHGRGSDEEDLLPLAFVFGADTRVISVRAPFSMHPGYAWFVSDAGQIDESVAALNALIDQQADAGSVILLGFSQGGLMACATAVHRRARNIQAVVSLSAPPLTSHATDKPLRDVPVFWGHGRQDPVVPFDRGQTMRKTLEQLGAHVHARDYAMGHTISPKELEAIAQWLTHIDAGG